MGSILYSHLNDSLLLDKSLIADKFRSVSDAGLQIALRQYREFCIAHLDDLFEEVAPEQGKLRLYVGDVADQQLLKQGAFYLDTVILSDPLFRLTEAGRQRVPLGETMALTGHRSTASLVGYFRSAGELSRGSRLLDDETPAPP